MRFSTAVIINIFVGFLPNSLLFSQEEISTLPPLTDYSAPQGQSVVFPTLEDGDRQTQATRLLINSTKQILYHAPSHDISEIGFKADHSIVIRNPNGGDWRSIVDAEEDALRRELKLFVSEGGWNDEDLALVNKLLMYNASEAPVEPSLIPAEVSLKFGEEVVTTEPVGEEWEKYECSVVGCRFRHRITGKLVILLEKVTHPLTSRLGLGFAKGKTRGSASAPFIDHPQQSLDFTVTNLHTFNDALNSSHRQGAKYAILSLGNLEGCLPCQNTRKTIQSQFIGDRKDIAQLDYNVIKTGMDSDLIKYFLNDAPVEYRIGATFPFPQVYVYTYDEMTNQWRLRLGFNGSSSSTAYIDALKALNLNLK